MPLPDGFDPWKHLFSQLLSTYNLDVERSFVGVPVADIETALGSLRQACVIQPEDSTAMVNIRMMLYYFTVRGDLPTPIYGLPYFDTQSEVTFKPQVKMHFLEDYNLAENSEKLPRATAEISFRLMNYNAQSINQAEAMTLATSIKEFFGVGAGFTWEKGTVKVVYHDPVHGYDFRLLAQSEGEAVRVIQKVLEVQGHTFDETLVGVSTTHKNFPVVPPMVEVYGKSVRGKRKRPITTVRFRYAQLHVDGLPNPITLVDTTGKRLPLVR